MKTLAFKAVLTLMLLSLMFSCKMYRDIENINPKTSKEAKAGPFDKASLTKLEPGEKVIVHTLSGFKYQMTFSNLSEDNLVGSAQKVNKSKVIGEEVVEIPLSEIESMYVRRKSAGVTIPVFMAAGVAAYFAFIVLAFALGG